MLKVHFSFLFLLLSTLLFSQESQSSNRVVSVVDSTHQDNVVLQQTFVINVPLDSVWNAYTTKKGWENWAVAQAEIDFKINGIIKTSYSKDAVIGDESTITLHIVNYVPKRMLTLQAELTKNFPDFMKEDQKDLYNTILFESLGPRKTQVISYGIGYKNNAKYLSLLQFFIQGNEQSYLNLINYLETGKSSVNY